MMKQYRKSKNFPIKLSSNSLKTRRIFFVMIATCTKMFSQKLKGQILTPHNVYIEVVFINM